MAITTFGFNQSGFTINDNATASSVGFFFSTPLMRIVDLQVTLFGLSHTFPSDLDFLLVGPTGRNLEFWSDAGSSTPIVNGNYTISDSGTLFFPDTGGVASGTYKPTDFISFDGVELAANWGLSPSITINHPAPEGTATLDSVFGGTSPNGNWSLFVRYDAPRDAGNLATWGVSGTIAFIGKPADFNNSTNVESDILWQNSDGTPAIWLMNGMNFIAGGGPSARSIRDRTGRSRAPATSTPMACPTSSGRAPMGQLLSG